VLSPAESDRLRVVLVASRNPLNIGAAARAMSNFGFRHLGVVNPYDVAFREARSAVGAASLLKNAAQYGNIADAVADCALVVGTTALRHRELQHPMRVLGEGAKVIHRKLQSGRVALLFGSEKVGLSNKDLSHCDWLLHIPTHKQNISMNLGQAVAVCLYELSRSVARRGSREKAAGAIAGDLERITTMLMDSLEASGYVNLRARDVVEEKLRRLVRRMKLSADDAKLWLGMARQISWKLRNTPPD
jgi:tRNA/rRNA methyltransferase